MAHNAYIRTAGDWSLDNVVTVGEFATIDLRQFQAINGDLGGTWAPSSQIVIGGSGIRSTGPSRFDDVTYLEMAISGEIVLADGGFLSVPDGASIVCNSNTTTAIDMESGSEMLVRSGASITFDGSSNWPLLTPARVVSKNHLRLGGSLRSDGLSLNLGNDSPAVFSTYSTVGGLTTTAVLASAPGLGGSYSWVIDIENPVNGATLSAVVIRSFNSAAYIIAPTYKVQRVHLATLATSDLSLATADAHLAGGTFGTLLSTLVTCTTNNVIDESTYKYQILCTTGTMAGPSDRTLWPTCTGGYTVGDLRP